MGFVVVGTAICVIAVMIIAFMFVCFRNEIGDTDNADTVFALILGIALTALFGMGMIMIQVGITEQQTIQIESSDKNVKS